MDKHRERKLFAVEDTFFISGRGLILDPGPHFDAFGGDSRSHSCSISIKRPDGSEIETLARFFKAFLSPLAAQKRYLERGRYECLCPNLTKDDVPIGSEVWTVEAQQL